MFEKSRLTPHLLWLIAVLLAIIAFMTLKVTNGAEINAYISFASSIASLILAVVAIFYAIVSNTSFSDSVSALKNSSEAIKSDSIEIKASSDRLSETIGNLGMLVNLVPESVKSMSAEIQEKIDKISEKDAQQSPSSDKMTSEDEINQKIGTGSFVMGVYYALYCIKKSHDTNKDFKAADVIESEYIRGILFGVISFISAMKPEGIDIQQIKDAFRVTTLGSADFSKIGTTLSSSKLDTVIATKKKIDNYFDGKDETVDTDNIEGS